MKAIKRTLNLLLVFIHHRYHKVPSAWCVEMNQYKIDSELKIILAINVG